MNIEFPIVTCLVGRLRDAVRRVVANFTRGEPAQWMEAQDKRRVERLLRNECGYSKKRAAQIVAERFRPKTKHRTRTK